MSQRKPLSPDALSALQKEVKPLVSAFDLISDHVIITDENANIIYANKAAEEQTGFTAAELIGKTPGDVWGGHMPKEFYERMWSTIKIAKEPFVGEVRNKKKNGEEYWQELRISPVLDDHNQIKVFIGIEPNITARKHLEMEDRQKFNSLEKLGDLMLTREMKMFELKEQIKELQSELESKKQS